MGHLSLYTINGIDPYNCLETNFSLYNQCEVTGNYIVNKRFGLGEIYVTNISVLLCCPVTKATYYLLKGVTKVQCGPIP